MHLLRTVAVASTFLSLAAVASARIDGDRATATPRAFASQPTPIARPARRVVHPCDVRVETETGHVHVALPPLAVAAPDRSDPWSGAALETTRWYAPLDTTDPWTGERIALRTPASVDARDPWR